MVLTRDQRLAVVAFVVATAYVPGMFSGAYMPRWWAIAILLPLASDLDPRVLPRDVGLLLAGGLAWAAASLAWTPIPAEGAMDLLFLILLALALVAAADAEDLSPALAAFGWGIAASSVLAALQFAGVPTGLPHAGPAGLFMNSEILAETAAPIFVWAAWERRWALAAFLAVPVALCESRVAILAVAAGALWAASVPARVKAFIMAAVALPAAATVFALGLGKTVSAFDRVLLWTTGALHVTPWGRGIGWWPVAFPGPMQEYAHSDALQLVVELGVGGLLLAAVPAMILLKGRKDDVARRAALVAMLAEAAISFPLHVPASGFLAALLAGGLVLPRDRVRRRELAVGGDALPDVRRPLPSGDGMVPGVA